MKIKIIESSKELAVLCSSIASYNIVDLKLSISPLILISVMIFQNYNLSINVFKIFGGYSFRPHWQWLLLYTCVYPLSKIFLIRYTGLYHLLTKKDQQGINIQTWWNVHMYSRDFPDQNTLVGCNYSNPIDWQILDFEMALVLAIHHFMNETILNFLLVPREERFDKCGPSEKVHNLPHH